MSNDERIPLTFRKPRLFGLVLDSLSSTLDGWWHYHAPSIVSPCLDDRWHPKQPLRRQHTAYCWYYTLHSSGNVARHLIRLTAGAVAMIGAADLHVVPGHHPGLTVASTQGSWSMRATAWTITRYGRTAMAVDTTNAWATGGPDCGVAVSAL